MKAKEIEKVLFIKKGLHNEEKKKSKSKIHSIMKITKLKDNEKKDLLLKFFNHRKVDNSTRVENAKSESLFGMELEVLIQIYGSTFDIPPPVSKCILYLAENGHDGTQGIFRIPGNSILVEDIKKTWTVNSTGPDFKSLESPHDASSILKQYLSALPQPLYPYVTWEAFQQLVGRCYLLFCFHPR